MKDRDASKGWKGKVDITGCGKVKFRQSQDISGLTLKIADVSKFDGTKKSKFYQIVDAPNGIAGKFKKAADFPADWGIKYSADGKSVYVHHLNGIVISIK